MSTEVVPSLSPAADVPSRPAEVAAKFCQPLEPVSGELGGTVMLVCELSPPQAEVVWRCGDTQLRAGKRFQIEAAGPQRSLTVTGLRLEDAGEYSCETRDDRTSAQLSVSSKQLRDVWVGGQLGGAHLGSSLEEVSFLHLCRVGPLPLPPTSKAKPLSAAPRVVKFTSGLNTVVAEEGREATFQCVVSPGDAAVTWFRDGALLQPSEKFLISQSGAGHSLTICSLTLEDAGQITAEAEGVQSSAALRVRGAWMGPQGGPPQGWFPGSLLMPARVHLVSVTWRFHKGDSGGGQGPGTYLEGDKVNSHNMHLVVEWAEVEAVQGGFLEEASEAEPQGWQGGRKGS